MTKDILRFVVAVIVGTLVAVWLVAVHPRTAEEMNIRPSSSADCTYAFQGATWDANEATRTVSVVGDSVVGQAGPPMSTMGQQRCHTVDVWALSGGAPCDLLSEYGSHMLAVAPSRVTLAFVGNATSPCMMAHMGWSDTPATLTQAQQDSIAYWYEVDLRAMIRWNLDHNIRTYILLPMQMQQGTWHGQMTTELISRYNHAADSYGGVSVDDSARNELTPGGVYRATVTVNGQARRLRHTDGTHLAAPYGTWSYASAVLGTILLDL
jgi:hypothetical protein